MVYLDCGFGTDAIAQMHRQLGNAVPLPLATAIGRALLDAEFEPWFALPEHERLSLLLD